MSLAIIKPDSDNPPPYGMYPTTNYLGNDISNEPFSFLNVAEKKCNSISNCKGFSISTYTPWKCINFNEKSWNTRINAIGTAECLGIDGTDCKPYNNITDCNNDNKSNLKVNSEKFNTDNKWHIAAFNETGITDKYNLQSAKTVYYKSNTSNPVNDLYTSYYSPNLPNINYSTYANTDYYINANVNTGADIKTIKNTGPGICEQTCNTLAGCIGFNSAEGNCYFKNSNAVIPNKSSAAFFYKNHIIPPLQYLDPIQPNKVIMLKNGDKCLDVGSTGLYMNNCNGSNNNTSWLYNSFGQIVNVQTGQCLDSGNSRGLWNCDDRQNKYQIWSSDGLSGLRPNNNINKCLDSSGLPIQDCKYSKNQQWTSIESNIMRQNFDDKQIAGHVQGKN